MVDGVHIYHQIGGGAGSLHGVCSGGSQSGEAHGGGGAGVGDGDKASQGDGGIAVGIGSHDAVDFVVVGADAGSKLNKAQSLNIPLIYETDLDEWLKQ